MHSMLAKWAPPLERSKIATLTYSGTDPPLLLHHVSLPYLSLSFLSLLRQHDVTARVRGVFWDSGGAPCQRGAFWGVLPRRVACRVLRVWGDWLCLVCVLDGVRVQLAGHTQVDQR